MSSDGSEADSARGPPSQTPSLIRMFHRLGSLHRPEEFTASELPRHTLAYASPDCTLNELVLELALAEPHALPNPAAGTRLVFQLIFPDLRNTSTTPNASPRFAVKDLGSVVIGKDGRGVEAPGRHGPLEDDGDKTLSDAKFVVGDYVSVAILQPMADGSVAPTSAAFRDPGGADRGRGYMSRGPRGGGGGGGRDSLRGPARGSGGFFPSGDWRRGQHVPTGPRAVQGGPRW